MASQMLTLARHAKSSWKTAGLSDHDRPLNTRGKADAPDMARRLFDRGCIPELILCSSAVRAMQTAAALQSLWQLDTHQIQIVPKLYLASPDTILKILSRADQSISHAMVIAHNPGLEELSELLAGQSLAPMPTMGIRHFGCKSIQGLRQLCSSPTEHKTLHPSDTHEVSADNQVGDTNAHSIRPHLIFEDYPKNTA